MCDGCGSVTFDRLASQATRFGRKHTMAPFPWESLKAETLRSICKDIGISLGTKRKREDMIASLKEVETRGGT